MADESQEVEYAHLVPARVQIYKATYSGVPVLEMITAGIPVMRRRADGWLNATQILKVAGFDKPQRTRILERDIQKGQHEKVQGGFGKYQGTWVPVERGLDIARQYHCEETIRHIIDYIPHIHGSPPQAPKHFSAPAASRRRKNDILTVINPPRNPDGLEDLDMDTVEDGRSLGSEEGHRSSSPSHATTSSRTPSPIGSPRPKNGAAPSGLQSPMPPITRGAKQRSSRRAPADDAEPPSNHQANPATDAHQRQYAQDILDYFVSDSTATPELLVHPPPDFDPNVAIDDDGHTAIHWACAMGRIRIVKLLISLGADIYRINRNGQTCLMRAVMFANNYDVRKFPELYELLRRTTLNIDFFNRTVFHHCVDLAMTKGKSHAARYYMETMLGSLKEYPSELADVINWRDDEGETALTMAARCRSKRLVKLLLDHDADPKIKNAEFKSAEMYLVEDEQFRGSPTLAPRPYALSYRAGQAIHGPGAAAPTAAPNGVGNGHFVMPEPKPAVRKSTAAQRAQGRCVNDVVTMLDALAGSFDGELDAKEKQTAEAKHMLDRVAAEMNSLTRQITLVRADTDRLDAAREQLANLEAQFARTMAQRHRRGWERWVRDEEKRDAAARELGLIPGGGTSSGPDATDPTGLKRKRAEEDLSDVVTLHSMLPEDDTELKRACADLREEIGAQRKRRKTAFDELVRLQAESGTGAKISEYRRLLKIAVPTMALEEIEAALPLVLESLESEQPAPATAKAS